MPRAHPWLPEADAPPQAAGARSWRRVWAARAIWLGLGAFGVAGAGQALLFQEASRSAGALLLAAALVLAGLAWGGAQEAPLLLPALAPRPRNIVWRRGLVLRLAGIAGAVLLALGAVAFYIGAPNTIFGPQGWLWLGSMWLLLVSCAFWYPEGSRDGALGPAWTRGEAAVFLGLIALALVTHLAYLDAIPWRFHFDEGYAYDETIRFYQGNLQPLFGTTWHETSLPTLWFAFTGGLMHIAGTGLAGVRLGVAFVGACLVIPVYGLARLVWGRTAAVIAAFGPAVSAVAIHYSRVSINNITTAFVWAVCFYFLLRGLRSRRPGDFVWAGLAAGTSQYTYYGTRLLPALLLLFVAYLAVFHTRALRERLGHFVLLGVGFLAGFGPLLGYFILHPVMWTSRSLYFLNVPAEIPTTWAGWVRDWNILAPLAWLDFLGLSVVPGSDTVYYAPMLLAPEAALLVLGLGVLIWQWRQPAAFLLLSAGLGVVLTGGLLLDASTIPNYAHWAPVFFVVYLALALPAALLLRALRRRRALWLAACVLVAAGMAADAGANLYGYIVDYPARVPADHSLEAVQGRFIERVGPQTAVYIVGPTWQPLYRNIAAMMGPQTPVAYLDDAAHQLPVPGDPTRDLAFVFYNDQWAKIPALRNYYPIGRTEELGTPDGNHVATAYIVPAAQARSDYGVQVTVTYTGASGPVTVQRQVPAVGALPGGVPLTYPLTATWRGALYVGLVSPITLLIQGGAAQVELLGRPLSLGQPVPLAVLWAPFAVEARLDQPAHLQLMIKSPGRDYAEVGSALLWPNADQIPAGGAPAP